MTVKLFTNARCFSPLDPGHPLSGRSQSKVWSLPKGAILATDGLIHEIGPETEVLEAARHLPVDLEVATAEEDA